MSAWNGCPKEECKKEWEELSEGKTQKEQDKEYSQGSYGLQHCEYPECHSIYFRGKNGWDCGVCGRRMCEGCMFDNMVDINDNEEYVCKGECEN